MLARNFALFAPPIAAPDAPRPGVDVGVPGRKLDLSGPVMGARYRLLHRLGKAGAMTIHAAEDVDNNQRVVIRLLGEPHRGAMALRYRAETRVAMNLSHPNIVDTLDFGSDILGDGEPVAYLVMEHLEGETLAATLDLDGPLPWPRVLAIAMQVCLAVIAAHEQCIVHGNITPANCFCVAGDGQDDLIKVLGFGGASFALDRAGACMPDPPRGVSGSLAPELVAGEAFDGRVDVWAIGLLMYRLLTDRMPYAPADAAAGRHDPIAMRTARPALVVPPGLEALVAQALALAPEQRHASAQALYDALADEQAASRPPQPTWEPRSRVLPPVLTNAGATRSSPEPVDPDAASAPLWAPVQAWPKWVVQATLG